MYSIWRGKVFVIAPWKRTYAGWAAAGLLPMLLCNGEPFTLLHCIEWTWRDFFKFLMYVILKFKYFNFILVVL